MEWNGADFQTLVDALAIFVLVLIAVIYTARRSLAAIFPASGARSQQALLTVDRSEQTGCSGCSVAKRHAQGAAPDQSQHQ
ncbi:MAG: hypothetical protein NXI24_17035 [bacterium]|nr:hypothetical protein [bacterium]